MTLAPVELNRVFRQSDAQFIEILSRLRLGDSGAGTLSVINRRVGLPLPRPAPVTLTPTNDAADKINSDGLASLGGVERLFEGKIVGKFKLEDKKLPSPLILRLKKNARVMFTKNDSEKRWVNGTLGVVRTFSSDTISVEIDEGGRGIVNVGRDQWDQYRFRYDEEEDRVKTEIIGTYVQFPLQPAWAITIHKAQGKTLPTLQIDLGSGAFAPGQTYVALSRARSLDSIWLQSPIRSKDVFCDKTIAAFYRGLFRGKVGGSEFEIPSAGSPPIPTTTKVYVPPSPQVADYTTEISQLISAAIEDQTRVQITYTNFNGNRTKRTIRPRQWVHGDKFTAYCELRKQERQFRVSRIVDCHLVSNRVSFAGSRAGEARTISGIEMVWNPPGDFLMQDPEDETIQSGKDLTHHVTLSHGFWLAKYPCTHGQWESVMGNNPCTFETSPRLPVAMLNWGECREWLEKMNQSHPISGGKWEFPTEAQWEYACRAGSTTNFCFGDSSTELEDYAWYRKNSDNRKQSVGQKKPNAWGLYDMAGLVFEWCIDWYGDYPEGPVTDPVGADSGADRVLRGGCWCSTASLCQSGARFKGSPGLRYNYIGFRAAMIPSGE